MVLERIFSPTECMEQRAGECDVYSSLGAFKRSVRTVLANF